MGIVELSDNVASKLDTSKAHSRAVVTAVLDAIKDITNDGDTVAIRGFGTFKNKTSVARKGTNPQTGKPIDIPAKTKLTFKASK